MLPTDRNSLIKWCLQKLGEPVIQINVDESQLENLCDEALELFKEFHIDGTGLFVKPNRITGSSIQLTADPIGTFSYHEEVHGGTSGAIGIFEYYDAVNKLLVFTFKQRTDPTYFQDGEIITGFNLGATATLIATNAQTLGMMDKKYVDVDDSVVGVVDIMKTRSTFGSHPINPFDLQYQLAQNVTIQTFLNADVVTYYMFQQDIELWDQIFVGKLPYFYVRKQNRIYIDCAWTEKFRVGEYLVFQYWGAIDPEDFPKVYGDKWLRKYLTALIEVQWGQHLTKYTNVTFPGGVILNGDQIQSRGITNRDAALAELRSDYEHKVGFKIG